MITISHGLLSFCALSKDLLIERKGGVPNFGYGKLSEIAEIQEFFFNLIELIDHARYSPDLAITYRLLFVRQIETDP